MAAIPISTNSGRMTMQYPVYRPSEEQVNKFFMLFYTMVGGFASIVQTQITDAYNLTKEDRKLFRFDGKKRITEAKACADELIAAFKYYMDEVGMYQWWLDVTDILEEDIRPDIQKCYFSLDNQFLRHGIERHQIYTNILMAEIMSKMLQDTVDRFAEIMRKENGISVFNLAERFTSPIRGVHERMRNAMEILYPASIDNKVFTKQSSAMFSLGFDIIGMKALDWERAYRAIAKATKLNAVNLSFEDKNGEPIEDDAPLDNSGTPWSDLQLRVLTIAYPDTPNKEVAQMVGRSVYEVVKQAKKLGLRKSEEYLREIRKNNLKRKEVRS